MKKLLFIFFLFLLESSLVSAQDTILFNNGDETLVKVTEVKDTEIKYQLWVNLNGPTYTKKISDIFMIKYKGGYREVYNNRQQNTETTTISESSQDDTQKVKKEKDNGINLIADISYLPIKGFEITPVVLYKFNRWVSLGVGFSVGGGIVNAYNIYNYDDMYTNFIGTNTGKTTYTTQFEQKGVISRVFSRVLITFTDTKVVPFMSIDLGLAEVSKVNFYDSPLSLNLLPQIGISAQIHDNNYIEVSAGPNFKFYTGTIYRTDEEGNDRGSFTNTITLLNPTVTIGYRHMFRFRK